MQGPLKIVLRDVSPFEDAVKEDIGKWAEKLDSCYPGIISCRVVVEKPHKHHHEGNLYRATVTLSVPEKQIVISREHPLSHTHEDIFVAIRDVFEDAYRQLEEYAHMRSGDMKDHNLLPHGVVAKLFPKEGYGFIEEAGGREIYFHRNSVLDGFDKLKAGTEVRFEEEEGEEGPQASTVKIIGKKHALHRKR